MLGELVTGTGRAVIYVSTVTRACIATLMIGLHACQQRAHKCNVYMHARPSALAHETHKLFNDHFYAVYFS